MWSTWHPSGHRRQINTRIGVMCSKLQKGSGLQIWCQIQHIKNRMKDGNGHQQQCMVTKSARGVGAHMQKFDRLKVADQAEECRAKQKQARGQSNSTKNGQLYQTLNSCIGFKTFTTFCGLVVTRGWLACQLHASIPNVTQVVFLNPAVAKAQAPVQGTDDDGVCTCKHLLPPQRDMHGFQECSVVDRPTPRSDESAWHMTCSMQGSVQRA